MPGGGSELNFTAETQEALRNLQRVIDQQEKLVQKYTRDNERMRGAMRQQATEARQANNEAFGPRVLSQISAYATGFASIAGVVRLGTAAVAEFKRESQGALQSIQSLTGTLSPAAAQARSGQEFAETRNIAMALAKKSGMSLQQAGGLATTLTGYGMAGEWETYAQLQGITDPTRAAEAIGGLRVMGVQGTSRSVLGQLLAANRTAKGDVGQLGMAMSKVMQYTKGTGMEGSELLAALSVASRTTRRADTAATAIGELAQGISRRGIGGGGLLSGVEELTRRGYSEQQLERILGAEGARGYNILSSAVGQTRGVRQEILEARQGDVLQDVYTRLEQDPITGAQRQMDRLKRLAEIKELGTRGDFATTYETTTEIVRAGTAEMGYLDPMRWGARLAGMAQGAIGGVMGDNPIARATKEGVRDGMTGGHAGPNAAPGDRVDVGR
jgi:hypothetical protein